MRPTKAHTGPVTAPGMHLGGRQTSLHRHGPLSGARLAFLLSPGVCGFDEQFAGHKRFPQPCSMPQAPTSSQAGTTPHTRSSTQQHPETIRRHSSRAMSTEQQRAPCCAGRRRRASRGEALGVGALHGIQQRAEWPGWIAEASGWMEQSAVCASCILHAWPRHARSHTGAHQHQ